MITRYANREQFLKENLLYLERDEVMNSLMIGIAKREREQQPFFIASIIDEDRLLGMIAGKNMILASYSTKRELYRELIIYMESTEYPGIIGPKNVCDIYIDEYRNITTNEMIKEMDQRIYSCTKVNNVSIDNGAFRLATLDDTEILHPWVYDFEVMVEGTADMEHIGKMLIRRIESETIYVLEIDGEVVSMAARSRPLDHTETVSLVYTPVKHRKKGYASKVVELLTMEIHKDGKTATLYTDLSNPTSNSIYIKIGYVPHCDSVMYRRGNQ